jgi:UDP-N-acetylglucosamine 4,6-dehydratase/5-epimerase
MNVIDDKVILVTGGTGSFGNQFAETVLKKYNPKSVRIFSRGEKLQDDMRQKFNDKRLRFFIGDVRDRNRLYRAMNGVDLVVHAAALKQVPACEYNPIEAIRTNVDGAVNVIDVALDNNVKKVMAISTDKAVHPVNLYGATKMTAEKLFVQANSYAGKQDTKFSCVRYGNVIGSRGSVIPLFLKQKKEGVLTITDPEMTRFWLTLEQGVNFVINCTNKMKGGEIFIPKISSMKIMDLAEAIAPDAKKKIIGIRPGEKIHEVLMTCDESRHSKEFDDSFVSGKKVTDGFTYSSDNNSEWLSQKELKNIIEKI